MRLRLLSLLVILFSGNLVFAQKDSSAYAALFNQVSVAYAEAYQKDTNQNFFSLLNSAGLSFLNGDNINFKKAKNEFKLKYALKDDISAAQLVADSFFADFLSPHLLTLIKGEDFYRFHEPALIPFNAAFCSCLQKNNPTNKILLPDERGRVLNKCMGEASSDVGVRIKMRAHSVRENLSMPQLMDLSKHSSEYSFVYCQILKQENAQILSGEVVGQYRNYSYEKRNRIMDTIVQQLKEKNYTPLFSLTGGKSTSDFNKINTALKKNNGIRYIIDESKTGPFLLVKKTAYIENKKTTTFLFQLQYSFTNAQTDEPVLKNLLCLPAEKIKNKKELLDGMIKEVDEIEEIKIEN